MTRFVIGPSGSGKTAYLTDRILADLKDGRRVILLVPEQATVRAEALVCAEAQKRSIPQHNLEILNFRRLCNRIFREYGGISYHAVSAGAKALIMWEALFSSAPYLKEFGRQVEDARQFVPTLLAAMEECKAYGVTAADLSAAAEETRIDDPRLSDKLTDLSLLYSAYSSLLTSGWEDPSDDLTRACDLLAIHPFFANTHLYLDAFKGFTPEQYRVLSYAFRQAESITVTLTMRDHDPSTAYGNIKNEYKKLLGLVKDAPEILTLPDTRRFTAEALAYLEKHLWRPGFSLPFSAATDAITTVIAANAYDEAEFVASDISRRLREGASYRDIAIIARDIHRYDGILDSVFQKHGLPIRISRKQELIEKPIFKLVTEAFHIRNSDWNLEDVITYVKTGLVGLTSDECDLLETYAYRWNIHGSQWTSDEDWYMNPDGYTDQMTAEGRDLLFIVNELRRRIILPLVKLHESLDGKQTVRQICDAIVVFLNELQVPDTIASIGCDDEIRLWNCFCDALDTMVDTLPDRLADSKLFVGLLSLVIAESNVGTLPATIDEILVGSAGQVRTDALKHTYLLGVNEDVFPATPTNNGFFSDTEKATLEICGINLSPQKDALVTEELYAFYTAATSPSDSLTLICSRSDLKGETLRPSIAFERVRLLFPQARSIDTKSLPLVDRIQNKAAAFEYALLLDGTECSEALQRYYRNDPSYAAFFHQASQQLVTNDEQLTDDAVSALFPDDLSLTQSRLERYVLCAFSYHCTYSLKLKETKRAEFRPSDIGNLVHRILEKFFAAVLVDGSLPPLTEAETHARIDDILDEYLTAIFGRGTSDLTPRAQQLFYRLRRTVRLLVKNLLEEFSQSEFVPRFFEMPITKNAGPDAVAPLTIPLPDGTNAHIYGVADRVDICRKGKDVYVRVVDYKTGKKTFSLSDIALGINLQMLLYLFSIWKDESGSFRRAVGCEGEILPAGVLYFEANPGSINAAVDSDDAAIYELAAKNLGRNGLLIDDEEVLRLMEKKLEGHYIPVTVSKTGALSARGSSMTLSSLEEMGHLMSQISQTVARIATEIKSGNADCLPLKDPKHDACRYCPHKAICRNPKASIVP